MELKEVHVFNGRNIYCHKPVVKLLVDAGGLAEKTTKEIEGFNEELLRLFPGLKKHHCSLGYEGGFVTRLEEGTYVCHVAEHLILELQSMFGDPVYFGKTRLVQKPATYAIIYEFFHEAYAVACGKAALQIVSCLAQNQPVPVKPLLDGLKKITSDTALGPSTRAIFREAKKRGIPVKRLGDESLLQLSYGKYLHLIQASLPDRTTCISVDLVKNKQLTKQVLSDFGVPVPEGGLVYTEDSAVALAASLGYPVVLKPYDGNQGKGVNLNIQDENQLRMAYRSAAKHHSVLLVERFIKGKDYRVLVVGDKVSAVAERKPASITGDGVHTIKELVAKENRSAIRGMGHERPLTKIKLDRVAKRVLQKLGFTENDIPAPGETILLRENGNLSTGGTARDCTGEMHPQNALLAVKIAQIIGLEIAGIDFVMEDISQPISPDHGAVVEVNAAPGLRMHLYPTMGQAQNVAADIIDYLYPKGTPVSIPIVSITGTNGKTTVTRLIAHVFSLMGKKVGMTCTCGTYVGNRCISDGDNTGPSSAQLVLANKEVDVAVLETARGGIVRKGLGYHLADVGVIVNISDDHVGQDGIDTLEELAFAKALVVEAVKSDGFAVLNGDDPMTDFIARRVTCNIVYFSQMKENPVLENHIRAGGTAVRVEDKILYLYKKGQKTPVVDIKEVPITFEGKARCNIENSLAAVAALSCLNIPENIIRIGLTDFKPDPAVNPGRFNIFNLENCQVMLDYGHNIGGYQSVIQFLQTTGAKRLVGVIGVPGDRLDKNIIEVGKISAQGFSKLIIKEDQDLRGRKPGEVARLLYQGAMEGGAAKENMEIILSETEALLAAVKKAAPGDLIVVFYEKFEPLFDLVNHLLKEEATVGSQLVNLGFARPETREYLSSAGSI
ncbi:cyanophycin synthetase [Candidatus Formimonas warabiya]|uniref:cyanophycin synthetase n=1 Tax=Formimonas warabiya TaxID=1761012 RepID=UPI0011D0E50C|nr:cyanophycin synthetase [Candidatus Formimonas warabiya]